MINKIAQLTTNNASGSTFTVPAGVTAGMLGVLILGTGSSGDSFTVSGWTSRVNGNNVPGGVGNMSFQVFTRKGLAAGQTFTVTYNSGTPVTQVSAVWFDTRLRDVEIVGTPWTRNGTSLATTTFKGFANASPTDVIFVGQERTAAANTVINTWSPATPTQDVYFESNTSTFPTGNTDTSHYIGHAEVASPGTIPDYTVTYNNGSTNGAGVMLGLAPVPKAATFVDTFTSLDTSRYTLTFPSAVSISNGRLAVVANGEYPEVIAVPYLDLTNSSLCIEVQPAPGDLDPTDNTLIQIYQPGTGGSNFFQFSIGAGYINVDTTLGYWSAPYDPVNHRWIRFRHVSGGTVAFETCATGLEGTWVQRAQYTFAFPLTSLMLTFGANTGVNSGGTAYFDNINNPPPGKYHTSLWSVWNGTEEIVLTGTITDGNGNEYNYKLHRNMLAYCSPETVCDLDIYCTPGLYPGTMTFTGTTSYPSVRTPLRPSDSAYPYDNRYPEDY